MKAILSTKKENGEKGEITIILACFLVALLLFLGLTIDLGNTYLIHLRMRNAVDLATNAIAVDLPETYSADKVAALTNKANDILRQNGMDLDRVNVTCEILHNDEYIYAARIIMDDRVNHYFARLYVNQESTIRVANLCYISPDTAYSSGYRITILDS